MSARSLLAVAAVVALSASLFLAQTQKAPDLPPGTMQAKAGTACLECHDSRIIVQQRLDKAAWAKEVDKMVKWGAVVDPKDRDALIEYFSANFPPGKTAERAPRVSRGK